jgi:hypothetical protein
MTRAGDKGRRRGVLWAAPAQHLKLYHPSLGLTAVASLTAQSLLPVRDGEIIARIVRMSFIEARIREWTICICHDDAFLLFLSQPAESCQREAPLCAFSFPRHAPGYRKSTPPDTHFCQDYLGQSPQSSRPRFVVDQSPKEWGCLLDQDADSGEASCRLARHHVFRRVGDETGPLATSRCRL